MIERRMETGQASNRASIFQPLPNAVMITAVLLTFGFTVLILATVAGLQLGNTLLRPSPFVPFEAIWPGQSIESLAGYARRTPEGAFNCTSGTSPSDPFRSVVVRVIPGAYASQGQKISCMYQPDSNVFRWINVAVDGGRVQELQLYSDVLPEDVLTLYWGMPDAISRPETGQRLNLFWEHSTYTAMASVVEPDSIVKIVTLTATGYWQTIPQ